MNIRNRRAIHKTTGDILAANSPTPYRIALWYTAVISVMSILSAVLDGILSDRIAGTGGLGNIGLRSVLSTAQTLFPIVQLIVTACLSLGFHQAILGITRGTGASPRTLLEGFRNFLPVLLANLFQTLLYISQAILSLYAASSVFMMLPVSASFYEVMEPLMDSASMMSSGLVVDDATLAAATQTLKPLLWIWLGIFLLLFLPTYFGLRFTQFCIADNPRRGALAAMTKSRRMLRGNRIALLKLDISMWWFYALQFLISVILYGDSLLPLVGIWLPWSETFSYYFFFVLAMVAQVIAYYFLMSRVYVAYALAYEGLQPTPPPESTPAMEEI